MITHGYPPNDIRFLSEGPPVLKGDRLPHECYVELKAKRLAKARVLWLNFDLLRERGITVPKEGLTPDYENKVLEAFAFAIPRPIDPPGLFTEVERSFWADRYGGDGLEGNWGSGRAASSGQIQIKGIGKTPLVGVQVEDHHAHGGISKCEAIMEAIWGEVNYRELPFEGSRVIAVIDTGTYTVWKDGGQEPRALIIRFDSVRPAHFLPKGSSLGDHLPAHAAHLASERIRVPAALKLLAKSLPASGIPDGLREFARRIGVHSAVAFARGFYHGTTAPSNREISGGYLDFGTQTAQPGFGQVFVLPDVAAAGPDFEEIKEVCDGLLDTIEPYFEDPSLLPSKRELTTISNEAFQAALEKEFLCLTGVPRAIVNDLADKPEVQDLVQSLLEIARDGSVRVCVDKEMPYWVSRFCLRRLLIAVAEIQDQGPEKIAAVVASELTATAPGSGPSRLSTPEYQAILVRLFSAFYSLVAEEGLKEHCLTEEGLGNSIRKKARAKNRLAPDLYRSNMWATNSRYIDLYQQTGNRTPLWDSINERIRRNTRTYQDIAPFQVVYSELRDPLEYSFFRYYFDAKKNADMMLLSLTVEDGQTRFRYQQAAETSVSQARLVLLNTATRQEIASASPVRYGVAFDFKAPASFTGIEAKDVEVLLLGPNNERLMRIDVKDMILEDRAAPIPPAPAIAVPAAAGAPETTSSPS